MPTTAYSNYFKRELDVEQLLALGANPAQPQKVHILPELSSELRNWIASDIQCPSCGVAGAVLVSGASSKATKAALRQPHFRFTAVDGSDAHRKFSDFSYASAAPDRTGALLDFAPLGTR